MRALFQDVTFYLTPSVEPSYEELLTLIELAGGTVLRERPQPQYVIHCIEVVRCYYYCLHYLTTVITWLLFF